MPKVNVKGYGNVNFPNGMDVNDIRDTLRRRYSDQTNSDLLQSASKYGAPTGSVAAPYKPSLMERAGQGVADVLSDTGIISNRYGAQQIGKNVAAIGEMLPGIGDVAAVDDFSRAAASGDNLGMGLAALGVLPAGDLAGKAGKAAVDVANNIKPATGVKLDVSDEMNRNTGMMELNSVDNKGNKLSNLSYSENPIIGYTSKGRNPEDYVYIEWMETDKKAQGKGNASALVKHLKDKYPDKTILADANDNSSSLLKKLGVTLIQ